MIVEAAAGQIEETGSALSVTQTVQLLWVTTPSSTSPLLTDKVKVPNLQDHQGKEMVENLEDLVAIRNHPPEISRQIAILVMDLEVRTMDKDKSVTLPPIRPHILSTLCRLELDTRV